MRRLLRTYGRVGRLVRMFRKKFTPGKVLMTDVFGNDCYLETY